jgi:DNA-binding NarL/FixJ family response regulator
MGGGVRDERTSPTNRPLIVRPRVPARCLRPCLRTAHVNRPISLILIDDSRSSRDGLVALIRAQPGFHILGASVDLEEAVRTVRDTRPDVVLLHLRQEDDDRLTLAGALRGEVPESRVIMMGMTPLEADLASFVRAGVWAFIMKDVSFDRFLSTIHSVAGNIRVLPTELTSVLFGQLHRSGVRGHTVKREVQALLSKLAVDSRVEVAAFSQIGDDPFDLALNPSH